MRRVVVTAPTGARIVAVAGPAVAAPGIDPTSWRIGEDGTLSFGVVDPDPFEQPTDCHDYTVFIDEEGRSWPEHRLVVRRLARGQPVGRPLAFVPTRSMASLYLRDLAEAADALRSAVEAWIDEGERPLDERDPNAIGERLGLAIADLDHLLPRRDRPAPTRSRDETAVDHRHHRPPRPAGLGRDDTADAGAGPGPGRAERDGRSGRDDDPADASADAAAQLPSRARMRRWRRTDRSPVLRRLR